MSDASTWFGLFMGVEVKVIAIDPGASGGIAIHVDGVTYAEAMPEGMTEQVDFLRERVAGIPGLSAIMEKVGFWMPGDHPMSACKFARHCGHLEAALYALGVRVLQVLPAKWQKTVCGTLPKEKAARKQAIKEEMARRYPELRVTLSTADALGILEFARLNEKQETIAQNIGEIT